MTPESNQERIRFPDETGRSLAELVDSCPSGAVIELAPGRYAGRIVISRALTIRGAGDLTRILGDRTGPVVAVRAPESERVVLDSLLIEDGRGEMGGGIAIYEGRVRVHNVHVRGTYAGRGGAIGIASGDLDATRIRAQEIAAERGGAVWVGGAAVASLRDSQIRRSEAAQGGAIAVEGCARLLLEGVTVSRSRATASSGGQALWVSGAGGEKPVLTMKRVRFEDAPMGMPLVIEPSHPAEVSITGCDMPRVVLGAVGVIDGGENRWR